MTIHELLRQLSQAATDNRDKGDKLERLMVEFFKADPFFSDRFKNVWLWNDWPGRDGKVDTGIDIVAEEREAEGFCAIQCKFYAATYELQKGDIDSFFTASGKHPFTTRIIVSTTDRWSKHAEDALENQKIPVSRLRVQDLDESAIDWSKFDLEKPSRLRLKPKKSLLPHQEVALDKTIGGFKKADRGKLIMACGSGKTYTSLKIAEKQAGKKGLILYLAPSISLISQSLKEWTTESAYPMRCYAVCSDTKIGKGENEDMKVHDLVLPATTNARALADHFKLTEDGKKLTVVFSTYQSIKVIHDAQGKGLPEFDLIVCDEAHRTTGMILPDEDESYFTRVHDNDYIAAKKRLYMTATPRIYSDASRTQAKENDVELCSMDDPKLYGEEFHRLGFGECVAKDLLSDYKVLVLAVDEKFATKTFQKQLADANSELKLEDAVKIIGCWNGLSKRAMDSDTKESIGIDTAPMRRAVAFSRSIKDSKKIVNLFNEIINQYKTAMPDRDSLLDCEVDHVDGTFNVLLRNRLLDWLREDTSSKGTVCRVLSNARCLSEGVDVPALDAVIFLNPRDSVVDVVQSVGRVMRKAPGKQYGYIILPVGIPADMPPEEALQNNDRFKVVWQVLQALRSHDDRFNAMINKLDLNHSTPNNLQVIGVGGGKSGDQETGAKVARQLNITFPNIEEWRDAIYAKIVLKCGDRRYWESWAADVATIAETHVSRIKGLLESADPKPRKAFDGFVKGLRENLNPSISEDDAIEMLAQHLITKPVFDALYEGYEFTKNNPVSVSMEKILGILERQSLEKETASLDKFYESVRSRAAGIDNAAGRQKIIYELYEKFFRTAFKKVSDRLGIVYTPVEVVDFIINSVNDALKAEFGSSVSDKNVHILDPFTGTGTFMVRLLQSGLIPPKDLKHKFKNELHANEIVLLAYYIAAINIEEAYHGIVRGQYEPFDGIVLTDTFQLGETAEMDERLVFPENNERASRQKKQEIRVIIGNPPYKAQQESEGDKNRNVEYPRLDKRISDTYALASKAGNIKNLYDSYVRAIRWASDRIKGNGIVGFVTNGSFIDANNMDGLRKCLADEFTSLYCFNLRGNARTSGETRRKEAGNVFDAGTRTPVAITLFVRNPEKAGKCQLFYHDIGDYLSREDKLKRIAESGSYQNIGWRKLRPNDEGDWIGQRSAEFQRFVPIRDKAQKQVCMFEHTSLGVGTNRDVWVYNFSCKEVATNISKMISFYNNQTKAYQEYVKHTPPPVSADDVIDTDPKKISWCSSLIANLCRGVTTRFSESKIVTAEYRPFCKQKLYFDGLMNHRVSQMPTLFPTPAHQNVVIAVTGIGASKEFSALVTDCICDLHMHDTGQCFPLYYYEDHEKSSSAGKQDKLYPEDSGFFKRDGLSSAAIKLFQSHYNAKITNEDLFYYVYGVLHSLEYKERFSADLKKMLPRIPFANDFWAFSKAGRKLAKWHLEYESVDPYSLKEECTGSKLLPQERYRVTKMLFGKQAGKTDKSTIIYNSFVTLRGIPDEAYEYIVNGKSAIEWIMERYQVTRDKDTGIVNDPNEWSDDPTYIVNLLKRIVRVSLETMKIVNGLPALQEAKAMAATK